MKTIERTSIPACDICKAQNDVVFDVPTIQGPWANLCESCLPTHGGNTDIGYKLEKTEPKPTILLSNQEKQILEKEFVEGFDVDDFETLMDSVVPTACPEGCEVEPDGSCCHGFRSINLLLE